MIKNKKLYAALWVSLFVGSTACQAPWTAPPATVAVIPTTATVAPNTAYQIGFSGPLSGEGAYYGAAAQEGIELALAEINQAGGIQGHPLEVVYEDDRNDTATAQAVLLKLARLHRVPLVIGINSSSVTLATCKKAEELQIVQYSIGSSPKIGATCSDFTFQLQGNDLEQGTTLAEIGQYLGAPSAAVVYINNDYGVGNKNAFVQAAEAAGIQLRAEIPLAPGGTDYQTEVQQLKQADPALVALIAYGAEGAIFMRQVQTAGIEASFVGDTNWGDPAAWQLAGPALTGMITLQAGAHTSPQYQHFAETFAAHYGKPPPIWAEYFYDEVHLAAQAIALGGYTGPGIRDATRQICETFVGASGPKQLDAENYVRWSFDWVQWTSAGQLQRVQK